MKADRRAAYGTGKRVREIEIPKEVHITPRMYQKLTEKIAGKPEERILSYLMLRSPEASPLLGGKSRPLRAGSAHLHTLHQPHPPLSGSDRPSHPERSSAIGSESRVPDASLPLAECGSPSREPDAGRRSPSPVVQTPRPRRSSRISRPAGRPDLRSKNCMTSPKNPASPNAAPTTPNAS